MTRVDIKEAMKILDEQNFIKLLSELFKHGTALDLVDIDGIRNTQNITDAERYIYDSAEKALDIIDLDELYENAETLGIDEKYPDFFQYLKELQLEHDDHDERIPSEDSAEEEGTEIEETDIEPEETESLKDTVTKNLVEGHHTGKESFNEKNQKADELRQKLDEERRRAIEESIAADKAADEIAQSKKIEAERRTTELNKQIESENQAQNTIQTQQGETRDSGSNAFIRDSYEESGQNDVEQVKAEYERDTYQKSQEEPSDSYGQNGNRQPEAEAQRSDSDRNRVDDYKPSEPARREDTAPEHTSAENRDTYPKDAGYQRDSYEESSQKDVEQVKAEYERDTYHKSQSVPNNRYEKTENEQTHPETAKREMIRKDVNNVHATPEIRQR